MDLKTPSLGGWRHLLCGEAALLSCYSTPINAHHPVAAVWVDLLPQLTMTSPDDVNLLLVTCGSVSAKFDLNLFRSESALGKKSIKCVLVGSEWVTPAKLETMGGKGSTRNWKRSIVYNKAPISTILFSGGVSQGTSEGSQQPMATPPAATSAATPDQISHSASNPKGLLCCPILAFIKASRLRKDAATIKKVLIDSFRDVDLSEAMKNLWVFSQIKLASLDYDYMPGELQGKGLPMLRCVKIYCSPSKSSTQQHPYHLSTVKLINY